MSSDEEKRQGPREPPNGGARAWRVALGAFAAHMYVLYAAVQLERNLLNTSSISH